MEDRFKFVEKISALVQSAAKDEAIVENTFRGLGIALIEN